MPHQIKLGSPPTHTSEYTTTTDSPPFQDTAMRPLIALLVIGPIAADPSDDAAKKDLAKFQGNYPDLH